MDGREVWIDTLGRLTRRLVMEDGAPVELAYALAGEESLVGNLYLGRIVNILGGMHAAFVDVGLAKNAFLSLDDMPGVLRDADDVRAKKRAVKAGDAVIVQVTKQPGGDKGPRVTMNPTLPGQFVVLLPTVEAVGVSRHIADEARREALHALGKAVCPSGMGLILRTAAENAGAEEIEREAEALCASWQRLAGYAGATKAPALLHADGDLKAGALRDLGVAGVTEAPLPDAIEAKLDKALRRKVWLNSGGYLIIDHTEALTVIDVNSGKFTGKRSLADTLLKLNIEAAVEAARQIRLRDLGGILLIDFVDMAEDAHKDAVLEAFEGALGTDRAKHHVHGFTGTGLLELTRRPVYQPIEKMLQSVCPCCQGDGNVPSPLAQAQRLLVDIRRRRASGDESVISLDVPRDTLLALQAIGVPEKVTLTSHDKGETT